MESYGLMSKPSCMMDRDCSGSEYMQDSEEIKVRIGEEIMNGEYDKTVLYYGISEEEPDVLEVSNGCRSKVCRADNCVFPDKYTNVMIYVPKNKLIHWFVVVK